MISFAHYIFSRSLRTKERFEFFFQFNRRRVFAFPHNAAFPPHVAQFFNFLCVSFLILRKLFQPEVASRFRCCCFRTILVSVPEAPMDEYHFFSGRENDVRCSRKVLSMKSKTISQLVEEPANRNFRGRVRSANSLHESATLRIDISCTVQLLARYSDQLQRTQSG